MHRIEQIQLFISFRISSISIDSNCGLKLFILRNNMTPLANRRLISCSVMYERSSVLLIRESLMKATVVSDSCDIKLMFSSILQEIEEVVHYYTNQTLYILFSVWLTYSKK